MATISRPAVTLSAEMLDRVWQKWMVQKIENSVTPQRDPRVWASRYNFVSRRSPDSLEFENWLFTQGATVQRINRVPHLQFSDEHQASWFVLANSL